MKLLLFAFLIFIGCDDGPERGTVLFKKYIGNLKTIKVSGHYLSTVTTERCIINVDAAASGIIGDSVFIVKRVGYYDCLFISNFSYRINGQNGIPFDFLMETK